VRSAAHAFSAYIHTCFYRIMLCIMRPMHFSDLVKVVAPFFDVSSARCAQLLQRHGGTTRGPSAPPSRTTICSRRASTRVSAPAGSRAAGPRRRAKLRCTTPWRRGPGHLRAGITGIVGLEVDAGVVMGLLCSDATLHGCRIDTDFDLITRTRTQLPATLALPLGFLEVKREIAMQT